MPSTFIKRLTSTGRTRLFINAEDRLEHAKADLVTRLESLEAQYDLSPRERHLKTRLKACESKDEFLLLRSDAASVISRHWGETEIQQLTEFSTKRNRIQNSQWGRPYWRRIALVVIMGYAVFFGMRASHAYDLKEIIQSGHMVIAHGEHSPPFSFVLNDRPIGFTVEICQQLVEKLSIRNGALALQIRHLQVSPQNRIESLNSGNANMECGSTTNNAERRKRVDLNVPHYISSARLLIK